MNTDKKYLGNDFKYYENYMEIQSIELACFILSVCHVVLLTEDWFLDVNLFRILQTAEMLMPSSSPSSLGSQQDEYTFDHHPHLSKKQTKHTLYLNLAIFNLILTKTKKFMY